MKIDVIMPQGVDAERDRSLAASPLKLKSAIDAEIRTVKVTIRGRKALMMAKIAWGFQIFNSSCLGLPY